MSPEERAQIIVDGTFYTKGQFHELITTAIREAVAEERERCKKIHQDYIDKSNVLHLASVLEEREACAQIADSEEAKMMERPRLGMTDLHFKDGIQCGFHLCARLIRCRSEKVSPDVVKGD